MKTVPIFGLWLACLVLTGSVHGDETSVVDTDYVHVGDPFPPVFFVTNIEDPDFLKRLKDYKAFERLDDDAVGLPIGIRILKGHRTKHDGTSSSSGLLAAVTLGIIPVVSNTEFRVRYDVFVQGKRISDYDFSMDSVDLDNVWSLQDKDFETKPAEELFLLKTIEQFLTQLREDESVLAVFDEYRTYFGGS